MAVRALQSRLGSGKGERVWRRVLRRRRGERK